MVREKQKHETAQAAEQHSCGSGKQTLPVEAASMMFQIEEQRQEIEALKRALALIRCQQ